MAKFNEHQVKEINAIISDIQKSIDTIKKKSFVIGARDRTTVQVLLKANGKETSNLKFFKCKRDYSESIVKYFIEKGIAKDKFSMNSQAYIYLAY
jgi:hypothetical protein